MLYPKLISILKSFSEDELKQFGKYLRSPVFSGGRDLCGLLAVLKKHHPEYLSPGLKQEKIYGRVFSGKKFEGAKSLHQLQVTASELTVAAEKFLRERGSDLLNCYKDVIFLKTLNQRNLTGSFENYSAKAVKNTGKKVDSDSTVFIINYAIEKEIGYHNIIQNREKLTSENLLKQSEYLLLFFLTEFSKVAGRITTNENIFNQGCKNPLIYETLNNINFENIVYSLKSHSPGYYAAAAVNYYCMMSHLKPAETEHYKKFKFFLEENEELFTADEKHNLYSDLTNLCWKIMHADTLSSESREIFRKELFNIYGRILEHKFYISGEYKYMQAGLFRNIFICSLMVSEFDWLEKFINKYSAELEPRLRDNMLNYSLGWLNFEKGLFELSLKYLSKVKYDYFYFRLDVNSLLLRIYYELDHYEQSLSMLDSYRHFLKGSKNIIKDIKRSHLSFLKLYSELLKIKHNKLYHKTMRLENEINQQNTVYKRWLAAKINELKTGELKTSELKTGELKTVLK